RGRAEQLHARGAVAAQPSFAVIVIGTLASAREIGQPFFAPSASSLNFAASTPGTVPVMASAIEVMVQPGSCFSIATTALVSSLVGSWPALVSANATAIVKQLACAAAISSSGFVPALPSSEAKRVLKP